MRSPAFQFYVDNFIEGTFDMTDSEVGLYMRLLCAQWSRGSIPNNDGELLRFSRGSTTLELERVKRKFEVCDDGCLRNARLEAERSKQATWREKSSFGGKKSAEMRQLVKGGSTTLEPPYQPNVNIPSPSPSPFPNTKVPPNPLKGDCDGVDVEKSRALKAEREALERHANEIYQLYPLKVGKPAALKAIKAALGKETPERLKELTEAFARARGGDLSYVPNPSTWFNQQRYLDDPSTWKPKQAVLTPPSRVAGTMNEDYDIEALCRAQGITP